MPADRFRRGAHEPNAPQATHDLAAEHAALLARLHDTTLQVLEYIARGGDFDEATYNREVKTLAAREAAALRDLLDGARDDDAHGLEAALRRIVGEARTLADHEIRLVVGPSDGTVEGPEVAAIAAAVREALTNVRKHADARAATVYVEVADGAALVTVKDDGTGTDFERSAAGLGVRRSIVGRMRGAGGHARLTSAPGEGVLVTIEYPHDASRSAEEDVRRR